jgi:large repetitive protein
MELNKTIETINMFLKRLSAALVTITCLGWAALGAAPETLTGATNNGKENSELAPLDLTFILTPVSPRCAGESNGKIDVQVMLGSGTAPFSYRLQKDGGTIQPSVPGQPLGFSILNLSKGFYKVYLTDANGFQQENTTTITENPPLTLNLEAPVTSPSCAGGTVNLLFKADGGNSSSYSYILFKNGNSDGNNSNGDFLNKGKGLYTAIVTDGSGCPKNYVGTINIDVPEVINFTYNILSEINCDNGLAVVDFNDLPADPFLIEVRNTTLNKLYTSHTSDYVYSNLDAGSYSIKVTRVSCPTDNQTKTFTIDPFAPISVVTNPVTPVVLDCGGVNDLTDVSITINGGKAGHQVKVVMDNNNGIPDDVEGTSTYGTAVAFTGLKAGNYTIRWNDVINPTCLGTQSYVISNPASPLVWVTDPVGTNALCYGDATGIITVNVSGGTLPRTIYVDEAVATLPINRAAGTYNVYVKDSKGCVSDTRPVTISQPDQLVVTHDPAGDVDVKCPGGNDGEIHMTVAGGVGGYKYDLTSTTINSSNVPTGADIVIGALSGGLYDVQVKDNNNCLADKITGIQITEPDPIVITQFDLDTIQCYGETATLIVKASGGGDPNMTYKLYKGTTLIDSVKNSGVVTFSNLIPSAYKLKVWSDLTCSALQKPFSVHNRKKLEVVSGNDSVIIRCPGDAQLYTLTMSGEAPFTYSIEGSSVKDVPFTGNTVVISTGLTSSPTGTLNRIIVKDKYGCEKDVFVKIFEPSPLVTSDLFPKDALCKGKRNGSVSLSVSGGNPGYTLYLVDVSSSDTVKTYPTLTGQNVKIANVPAGTYNLKIKDKKGCLAPNPPTGIVVNEPDSLKIEDPVYDEIKCFDATTSVTLNVTGGWPVAKTVTILGEGVNSTISSGTSKLLKAGFYTLTAGDDNGCRATDFLTLTQPKKLVLDSVKVDNVSCNGADDAKISFMVFGGVPDYQYGLGGSGSAGTSFPGASFTIDSDLKVGKYNLVIKDLNNCQSNIVPVTITEPDPVVFNVRFDSVTCNGASDGKIIIENAKGGNNSFSTYLTKPGGTEKESSFPVINDLPFGEYKVRIEDTNKCTSETKTVTIGQPELIVITGATISDSLSCFNDQDASITITAIGGLPYDLRYQVTGRSYQPEKKFTNLPSGEYEIFVKNNQGNCETKFPTKLIITNPDPVVVTSTDITNVSCYNLQDGEVHINASGGTGTLNYLLIGAPESIPDNPNSTGRFKQLGDLNSTFTTYNYSVTDKKNCKKTGSFVIANPPELKISKLDSKDVVCNNQSNGWIEVEVTGGTGAYSFQRTTGAAITPDVEKITNSSYKINGYWGGDFTPVVNDINGCTKTLTPAVTIVDPKLLVITEPIEWGIKKCNGDMDDVTVIHVTGGTKGYYYSLDNGTNYSELNDSIFEGEPAGSKFPRVKDKNECETPKITNPYLYREPTKFSVFYEFIPIQCFVNEKGEKENADMELKIVGGTGPYTLSINDDTFKNDTIPISKLLTDTTTLKLSDEGIDLIENTSYYFYLKDHNNCHVQNFPKVKEVSNYFTDTIFTRPEKVVLDSLWQTPVTCQGYLTGEIGFKASGGVATNKDEYTLSVYHLATKNYFENSDGFTSVSKLPSGFYQVTLSDKNGCTAEPMNKNVKYTDTISVDYRNDQIKLAISQIKLPDCDRTYDAEIEVDAANFLRGGIFYNIYFWNETIDTFDYNLPAGEGYIAANNFYSTGIEGHKLYFENDTTILKDIGIGRYLITITDSISHCTATYDTTLVSINGGVCPPLRYYNAFTPHNGDRQNNQWQIYGSEKQAYTLQIYTGYGELVRTVAGISDKEGIKWDGLDTKKRPAPVGTYIYLLKYKVSKPDSTLQDTLINGNVSIIRDNGR